MHECFNGGVFCLKYTGYYRRVHISAVMCNPRPQQQSNMDILLSGEGDVVIDTTDKVTIPETMTPVIVDSM